MIQKRVALAMMEATIEETIEAIIEAMIRRAGSIPAKNRLDVEVHENNSLRCIEVLPDFSTGRHFSGHLHANGGIVLRETSARAADHSRVFDRAFPFNIGRND